MLIRNNFAHSLPIYVKHSEEFAQFHCDRFALNKQVMVNRNHEMRFIIAMNTSDKFWPSTITMAPYDLQLLTFIIGAILIE